MPYPKISIITLNYNQPERTNRFLRSTVTITYPNYEILVCDMASDLDPRTTIDITVNGRARLLLNKKNLGFAGGNNWGIEQADGDFLFIVNNDTLVTPALLELLLQPMLNDEMIAVTCPTILQYPHTGMIEYAGFKPMNFFTGRTSSIGFNMPDEPGYRTTGPTFAAHGCAMLIRWSALQKTGLFPADFFLYYEEWDLSMRIKKAGYQIWHVGPAEIYHEGSASIGNSNPMKEYYLTRNRILFIRRNASLFQLLVFTVFFSFLSVPKSIISYLVKGQFKHLSAIVKAIRWNLQHNKNLVHTS